MTATPSTPPSPPPLPSHVQGMMTQMVSEASSSLLPAVQSQAPPIVDIKNLLDARSLGMVQEIKNHLNLSNEAEALRMLIALGYQKIRPQF